MPAFAHHSRTAIEQLGSSGKSILVRQDNTAARDDGGSSGGGRTPLLFFIALGFGVVFTNLWIIVGVKYCFRYNARTRALRAAAAGETEDSVAMEQPARPRRRREKKLMTMDEVTGKFPIMKYKSWVLQKSSTHASDPESTHDVNKETAADSETCTSTEFKREGNKANSTATASQPVPSEETPVQSSQSADTIVTPTPTPEPTVIPAIPPPVATREADTLRVLTSHPHSDSDIGESDSEDEHMTGPILNDDDDGDTCAICIDTFEDDDDIRALTCGHVFHAACVDPWLTVRRACCPLCKADYYVPKPIAAQSLGSGTTEQIDSYTVSQVNTPRGAWFNFRGSRNSGLSPEEEAARARREQQRVRRARRRATEIATIQQEEQERRAAERLARRREQGLPDEEPPTNMVSSLRQAVSGFRFGRTRSTTPTISTPPPAVVVPAAGTANSS